MLKNHEKHTIEKALKFYKEQHPLLNELDKIHITNLVRRVNDLSAKKQDKNCNEE